MIHFLQIKNIEFFFGSGNIYKKISRRARTFSIHTKHKVLQAFDIQRHNLQSAWVVVRRKKWSRQRSLSASRSTDYKDVVESKPFISQCENKADKKSSKRTKSLDRIVDTESLAGTQSGSGKKKDRRKRSISANGRLSRDNANKPGKKGKRKRSQSAENRVSRVDAAKTSSKERRERSQSVDERLFRTDAKELKTKGRRERSQSEDDRLSRTSSDKPKTKGRRERSQSVDGRLSRDNAD